MCGDCTTDYLDRPTEIGPYGSICQTQINHSSFCEIQLRVITRNFDYKIANMLIGYLIFIKSNEIRN